MEPTIISMKNENSFNNNSNNENRNLKGFEKFWTNWKKRIWGDGTCMDHFSKANLFILCCVAACFLLIICLAAFSCEVSWILELRGDLPTPSYILCIFYFLLFVASTILIHGLATGLSWGLFFWSIVVGVLAIPELCLVMYMTIQYWGLQSTHGLVELVGYLIRLVVTCLTLICVIPTALRWRREKDVLNQLQSLASRLQISNPTPTFNRGGDSIRGSGKNIRINRRASGFDNPGFLTAENSVPVYAYNPYGSQNEFNASIFGLNPSQYIGPPIVQDFSKKRTQSLLDLRYIVSPQSNNTQQQQYISKEIKSIDTTDDSCNGGAPLNNEIQNNNKKSNKYYGNGQHHDEIIVDPIYYAIDTMKNQKSLGRNCVSLENLNGVATIKNDLGNYGNNLLQNYHHQWPPIIAYHPNIGYPIQYSYFQPIPQIGYGYQNSNNQNYPYMNSSNNSRQSLGQESDDYRKYRDVAL